MVTEYLTTEMTKKITVDDKMQISFVLCNLSDLHLTENFMILNSYTYSHTQCDLDMNISLLSLLLLPSSIVDIVCLFVFTFVDDLSVFTFIGIPIHLNF